MTTHQQGYDEAPGFMTRCQTWQLSSYATSAVGRAIRCCGCTGETAGSSHCWHEVVCLIIRLTTMLATCSRHVVGRNPTPAGAAVLAVFHPSTIRWCRCTWRPEGGTRLSHTTLTLTVIMPCGD